MEEREKVSDRYPIIKIGLVPISKEEEEDKSSFGGLSLDAVHMISGGGPAAIRPKVQNALINRSPTNQGSSTPSPATPNLKKV
jgi:hypothetical protein